jgi:hypothetical protein
VQWQASGETGDSGVYTRLVVRAGLAAVPYLIRQKQWTQAGSLLEWAFTRDPSRSNAAAVLPAIQQIAAHDPREAVMLAAVLQVVAPAAAEAQLRAYLDDAVARGDYHAASVAAGRLIELCRGSGRLAEALTLAGQKAGYTRQAGLGPWTQVGDEVQRLQVLTAMGQASQVLAEVQRLRDRVRALPATPGPDEAMAPWDVREALLGIGRDAAYLLDRWDDALSLNAEVTASLRDRRAPDAQIALARFSDSGLLLSLGRTDEALDLLLDCRRAFLDANDSRMLGRTLDALAITEDARGHSDAAIRLERDALRYTYLAEDVDGIAVSYHNLGIYLSIRARQPVPALASHLAAALIRSLAGAEGTDDSVRSAATDLREFGTAVTPPADAADLGRQIGDIPGTDLARLLQALSPDPAATQQALRDLIAQAKALAAAPSEDDDDDDES